MRRLMLLRHAKTETEAPSGRDQDRRLDERGRRDAAEIGNWIGRHPPFANTVMVSPAVRAHQTWFVRQNHELRPVSHAEFGHGPAHVGAHGGRAHVQLLGDLVVGEAVGDEGHHFTLPLGDRIEFGRRRGFLGPGGEFGDQPAGHAG